LLLLLFCFRAGSATGPWQLSGHVNKYRIFIISHYLKFKLNPCQHGCIKSKSTTTNLVTYLDFINTLADSQHQTMPFVLILTLNFTLSLVFVNPL
jgi:hypothetical protein